MKKTVKKICAFALTLVLVISCCFAAPKITPRSWVQLEGALNWFIIAEDGLATILADTEGQHGSTKVTVGAYVERQKLTGGGYSTVSGLSWTDSGSTYAAVDKQVYVTTGYYYRLRTEHTATGPNGTETTTKYSNSYKYQ